MPSSFCGRGGRGDAKAAFAVRVEYGRRIVYNRKNMPDAVCSRKDAAVLVYCRSGRRSKQAAAALAQLGYTGVYEFGRIMTWPYDVVK